MVDKLTHLKQLEAESIHIIREVAAEFDNPVMLYSIGKDSAVMLHLARKAFFPGKLPFPVMHVDTRWKFQEMYKFRDKMVEELGLDLITHVNPDGVAQGINPFTHGSAKHTDIMKTEGLKQALDKYGFDAAFGGARARRIVRDQVVVHVGRAPVPSLQANRVLCVGHAKRGDPHHLHHRVVEDHRAPEPEEVRRG